MLLDEYGIHPWQMDRWTGRELDDLGRFHQRRTREAEREEG